MVELESVAHFNEAMKTLTARYFAVSLESVETFWNSNPKSKQLGFFDCMIFFTSVITTSRERLEQNPFGFEQNKKRNYKER
ncbi:hypothetical protein GCM10020331_080520 [Ectobacillus funiculus]